jgi:hypothetical protein
VGRIFLGRTSWNTTVIEVNTSLSQTETVPIGSSVRVQQLSNDVSMILPHVKLVAAYKPRRISLDNLLLHFSTI